MNDGEMRIRPALHSDRPAIKRICAHTWDWGDYVPDALAGWLADESTHVIVGEVQDNVVAVCSIVVQPAGQVWLEGMRVDPAHRRAGIASQFLDHCLAWAQHAGSRVVRLATGSHNTAVHTIASRHGMEQVCAYVRWVAEPLASGPLPTLLGPVHASSLNAFLRTCPLRAATRGLYCKHWSWQELSASIVADLLESGQVAAEFSPGGKLAAVATFHPEHVESGELWVGFVDGHESLDDRGRTAAVTTLAVGSRVQSAHLGARQVSVMVPDAPWLRSALSAAGFGFGDWQGALWVFERWVASDLGDSSGF